MKHTRGLEALVELQEVYEECAQCPQLCESRTYVVHASGSASAPILVVGDNPGEEEDAEGVPFIGKAGKLMLELLRIVWPESEELAEIEDSYEPQDPHNIRYWEDLRDFFDDHVCWTNVVQCWPTDDEGASRKPTTDEVKACKDRLHRVVYAVDPMLIIATGKLAATTLLGKTVQITKDHGVLFDISLPSPATGEPVRYSMLTLLSPGFLLHRGTQNLMEREDKGDTTETREDLAWVLSLLNEQYMLEYGTPFPIRG